VVVYKIGPYSCNFCLYSTVFRVSQLNYASQIWFRQTVVAMVTKISYTGNLVCAGATAQMLDTVGGFQGQHYTPIGSPPMASSHGSDYSTMRLLQDSILM